MTNRFEGDPELPPEPDRPSEKHPRASGCFAVAMIALFVLLIMFLGLMSSLDDMQILPDCLGNC